MTRDALDDLIATSKALDPAVVAAMKKLEATVNLMNQSAPSVHQI